MFFQVSLHLNLSEEPPFTTRVQNQAGCIWPDHAHCRTDTQVQYLVDSLIDLVELGIKIGSLLYKLSSNFEITQRLCQYWAIQVMENTMMLKQKCWRRVEDQKPWRWRTLYGEFTLCLQLYPSNLELFIFLWMFCLQFRVFEHQRNWYYAEKKKELSV